MAQFDIWLSSTSDVEIELRDFPDSWLQDPRSDSQILAVLK
jgi:hypothetical protein